MPQSKYTNADLKRFDRTPGNYTEYGPWTDKPTGPLTQVGAVDFESADSLLAKAREALSRADALEQETGAESIASIPERLAALSAQGRIVDPRRDIRQLTGKLHTAGVVTGAAAIPGMAIGAGPILGAAGGLLMAPDVVRRMILPDEDESRLGGFGEAALIASPLAAKPALKGLRALKGIKGGKGGERLARDFASLAPEAQARNIEAENLVGEEGFGRGIAGRLAGIKGAGKSREIPTRANESTFGGRARPAYSTVSKRDVLKQKAKLSGAQYLPKNRPVGMKTFQSTPAVEEFAQGPRIERGLGSGPVSPLFYRGAAQPATEFERLASQAGNRDSLRALLAQISRYATR